jgi:DNA-directed RNA polymerase specialized sigma54-like protein
MATIVLKKYETSKYPTVILPNNASQSSSVYVTEDLRWVVYKFGSTEWGWYALKEKFYNDLQGVSRYDSTKTSVVETLQHLVDEEEHDEKLWKE